MASSIKLKGLFLLILLILLNQANTATTSPIFVTTFSGSFESGSVVLSTSSPTTSGSFSSQTTTITYTNSYFTTPVFAHGIKYIYANWIKTTTAIQTIFDISSSASSITSQTLRANFTVSTVQQFSVNYIVCLPNSYFFLDVRSVYQDLTTYSTIYTSSMASSRSQTLTPPYKNKSNSSNAQVIISTVGLSMMRQSNTFEYTLSITSTLATTFSLSLTVMANNGMRFIRFMIINYESTASSYTGYIDMGTATTMTGNIPDVSGQGLSATGTIFTGMTDWAMSDTNTIITYNMSLSLLSYSLTSSSVTRSKTAYLWYRDISCPKYYYLVDSLCHSCDYTCTTCSDSTNTSCLSCQASSFRTIDLDTNSCPCDNNYLDVRVHICQVIICPTYCTTCSTDNVCIGCVSTYFRSLSNGSCICSGYTLDMSAQGIQSCQICFPTCYTCSLLVTQTACLTCNRTRDHREFLSSNNTCVCVSGYYEIANLATLYTNYIYNGVPCLRCLYHCQTCSGNTSCLTCNSTLRRTLDDSTNLCVCQTGYYDDGQNQTCGTCNYTCATCNSTGCITCPNSRSLNGLTCPCLTGYYDSKGATCSTCNHTCYTCTNSSSCLTCNSTYFRNMTANLTCVCLPGYYDVGVQTCAACQSTCASCNGENNNNCLSCSPSKFRQITTNNTCVCKSGYYDISPLNSTCDYCDYKCGACSVVKTNCTSCNATYFRNQSGTTCVCTTGYYDDGGSQLCLKCLNICLTCTSNLNCLTCDSKTRNTTNLSACPCLTGFYDSGASSCQPCMSSCLTCSNPNNCTDCPSTRQISSSQMCVCKARTFEPACAPCLPSCLTCSITYDQCITCNGTAMRYLVTVNGTPSCICHDGYYDDKDNQLCAACNYSCATCTNASACVTCPTNRKPNGSFCSCQSSFYQNSVNFNCLACHYSCFTCSQYSVCTSCNNSNFRTTSNQTTLCVCMTGYYEKGGSTCYPCLKTCASCSSYYVCTSCNSSQNLYLSSPDCLCMAGYFLNSSSLLCVACDYSCATCLDNISCATCQANRTSVSGGLCTCIQGMFDSSQTKTCQPCAYPCVSCVDNSSKCLSCDSNRTYISSNNTCICNESTYNTGVSCASCLSTCQTCTNGSACLTCLTNSLRELDATNQCVCPTGYHDEAGTILICKACNYTCVTCTVSTSCSSCYSGRIAVNNSFCTCPSTLYYDNGASPQCLSCKYSCQSCSVINSNCTSCLSTNLRTKNGSNCVCNTRYYDDGKTGMCQNCHYSCLTCASNSSCITCNSSSYRQYVFGPLCSCMTGYFDVTNNQLCSNCSHTCLTCVSGSLFCSSCPTNTRKFDNISSSCPCNPGLYDSGSATCSSCSYQCATCSNATACITCPQTRQPNSTFQCQCKNGYYNVVNQALCSACSPICQLCSDQQTCTECDTSNNFRSFVNNSCVCSAGYYDASTFTPANYVCQLCPISCETCISKTNCLSCNIDYKRVYNETTFLCDCADGYFDDGSNSPCIACPYDCLTCSSATVCLNCSSTRYLSNISRCVCTSNYFANGTLCEKCPNECSTCTSSSVCTGCVGVRILSSGACICPIGLFSVAGTSTCSDCHYSCSSCVSSSQCSTCNSTLQRYLTSTFCFCKQYYYDDPPNQLCQPCNYSCLTCNQATVCLTCDGTKNRIFDSTTQLCSCVSGYFEDSSKLCIKCSYSCLACLNSSTTCTSCVTTSNRVLKNNKCQCPTYFYYDTIGSTVCASCNYTCYSCSGNSTSCTSCLDTNFRSLSGSTCPCSSGYYSILNMPVCSTCAYQCVTCQGDGANCTLCSSANFRNTTPACSCINGYYDNGTKVCLTCNYTCETCLNIFSCSTCNLDTNHRQQNNITLFCDCISQYYDNGSAICQPCFYTCLTCSHPSICLKCPSTRAISLTSCLCQPKYYDDGSSLLCKSCHYSCKTCSDNASCSSCNSVNFRVFNESSSLCSCNTGYFDTDKEVELCSICDSSCLTCLVASACATCPNSINKTINATAGSNFCICFYGFYENATAGLAMGYNSVCKPCHYSCQTCNSTSTFCTLCNTTANRYLTTSSRCQCLIGFFQILGQQNCLNCYSNCLTCFGTLANNCLSCDNNTYNLNNSCYLTCPAYYTNQTTPSRKCVSCPTNCLSCPVSTTTCSLCASPYFIFAYNSSFSLCVDSCPQFYYLLNKTCLACVWPCVTCNSSTSCLSCSPGYYLANNYCYPCQKSCLTCSGSTALDCLTCIVQYILKNGVCQKMQCGATQYVDSILGCLNCSSNFANSLTCLSTGPLTCQSGYILKNKTCGNCTTVTGYVYDSTTGRCKDLCGDGIVITDLCDDGNTLNGDGCSSVCTIQSGWKCPANNCKLDKSPNLTLIQIKCYPKNHTVVLKVQLNMGLRLIRGNFLLKFTSINNFIYSVNPLKTQYTSYQLIIVYYQSPQNQKLSIGVKSPISRLLAPASSRQLQTTTDLELSISLSLNLDVPIQTYPPAIYVSQSSSQTYSQHIVGLIGFLHAAIIVAIVVVLIKRLKVMLFVIDALNSITILYIVGGLGLYNITLLSGESFKGLQPFVYPFGQYLKDETTNFFSFNYRSNFFSSTIIQVVAIFITLVGLTVKSFTTEQNSQNYWHYYRTSFVFAFSYDLLLSAFCTLFWSPYYSYQSSYSWMASLFTLIWIVCEAAYYYRTMSQLSLDRKIVPDFTYITGVTQQEKSKNQINNIMLDFQETKERTKEKERHDLSRDRDDPRTEEGEEPINDVTQPDINVRYYDLTPSKQSVNTVLHSSHITPSHLPIVSIFFSIIFSLLVNIQSPKIRAGLLLGATLGYLLAVLITKNQTLKAIRTIKLTIFALLYVAIAASGLAGATLTSINLILLDIVLVVLICLALVANFVCFIVNVLKSEAYREHVKQKEIQQANERKKRQAEYRQKIYNNNPRIQAANTTNSKLAREQPKSSINIFEHQIQVSEEQVQQKQLKISSLKKFRDQNKPINREKNNSTMLNQIDDEFSAIEDNILPRKELIDDKSMVQVKDSRVQSSRGNRVKAIRDSQLSRHRRESPSSYFDNTLQRIEEEKIKKKGGRSHEREEISPSAPKKKLKKRAVKGSNLQERRIDDEISLNNDEKPAERHQDNKNIEDILEEMDMPKGFKSQMKIQSEGLPPRLFQMDEISSIKEERREEFMEQGIDDEKGGLTVFNKILQDYKVYRNKKVSKKKMKEVIHYPN